MAAGSAGREEEDESAPCEAAPDDGLLCGVLLLGSGRYGTGESSYGELSLGESVAGTVGWLLKEPAMLRRALLIWLLSCSGWFTCSFMSASLLVSASLLLSFFHLDVHWWGNLHIVTSSMEVEVLANKACATSIAADTLPKQVVNGQIIANFAQGFEGDADG